MGPVGINHALSLVALWVQGGPMGPMGGPLDFARNKSKFQEIPETGVTFDQVGEQGLWCGHTWGQPCSLAGLQGAFLSRGLVDGFVLGGLAPT